MQVRDAMSDDVQIASPNQSIRDAAILMAKIDAGVLPVGENDRLVGMITDRDIAVRAIALGKGPDTKVRDVMSEDVKYCFEERRRRRGGAEHGGHQGPTPAGPEQRASAWSVSSRWATLPWRTAPPMPAKRSAAFPSRAARIRSPVKAWRGRASPAVLQGAEARAPGCLQRTRRGQ